MNVTHQKTLGMIRGWTVIGRIVHYSLFDGKMHRPELTLVPPPEGAVNTDVWFSSEDLAQFSEALAVYAASLNYLPQPIQKP
jgi:hypothetical protein